MQPRLDLQAQGQALRPAQCMNESMLMNWLSKGNGCRGLHLLCLLKTPACPLSLRSPAGHFAERLEGVCREVVGPVHLNCNALRHQRNIHCTRQRVALTNEDTTAAQRRPVESAAPTVRLHQVPVQTWAHSLIWGVAQHSAPCPTAYAHGFDNMHSCWGSKHQAGKAGRACLRRGGRQ